MTSEDGGEVVDRTDLELVLAEPKFAADFLMAEYKALRDEILKKMEHRSALVVCSVTVSSAVLGFGIDRKSSALLLVSPLVSLLLGTLLLLTSAQIMEISEHLRRRFEVPMQTRYDQYSGWHQTKRHHPRRRFLLQMLPYHLSLILIAIAPAVLAVPLALANTDWVVWMILGVDLVLLAVYTHQCIRHLAST